MKKQKELEEADGIRKLIRKEIVINVIFVREILGEVR